MKDPFRKNLYKNSIQVERVAKDIFKIFSKQTGQLLGVICRGRLTGRGTINRPKEWFVFGHEYIRFAEARQALNALREYSLGLVVLGMAYKTGCEVMALQEIIKRGAKFLDHAGNKYEQFPKSRRKLRKRVKDQYGYYRRLHSRGCRYTGLPGAHGGEPTPIK